MGVIMDIKIRGTTKAAILVYDISDKYAAEELSKAQRVSAAAAALSTFFEVIRSIRKYESFPEGIECTDKKAVIKAEEYYRLLLLQCLSQYDVEDFID